MPRETHDYAIADVRLGKGDLTCAISVHQEDDAAFVVGTLHWQGFSRGMAIEPGEADAVAGALVDAAKKARAINEKDGR